jgi:hypothetical protein
LVCRSRLEKTDLNAVEVLAAVVRNNAVAGVQVAVQVDGAFFAKQASIAFAY